MVMWCWIAIACVGAERLGELYISRRNTQWSAAQGAITFGQDHLGLMKALHAAFLLGIVAETTLTGGRYQPFWTPVCLAGSVCAQALRYWCIMTLGRRWNIGVVVIPNLPPVTCGPYAFFKHPNYVAVVVEGAALPMIFGAWKTALVFSILNAALLRRRIACESQAIAEVCGPYVAAPGRQSGRAA